METESSGTNCLPSDDECTKDVDYFFAKGLYNSCKATDELLKSIEESQDEALARKALALYQKHYSTLDKPWSNVTFMYGIGLLYMHFNAYNWAIKAFREAIYVQPNFVRSRDVHTRLGLIFKATGRYKLSDKHFNMAINDTRTDSGICTKLELEFHLAHLNEIQGKFKQSKEAYERLLQENDLPHQLSANIYRQLGWMWFKTDVDGSHQDNHRQNNQTNAFIYPDAFSHRMDAALNYLRTSYRTYSDAKTSYYLGRCFTNIGKFQDAFDSYRSMIDREESTADTWCSIGVLYHRQNQPHDALQAYIRCVQNDKQHTVAWVNLGILYESHNQFQDALKCYQHVLRSTSKKWIEKPLKARINYIHKQMAEIEESSSNNGRLKFNSDKLLNLEDLWNLESKISSGSTVANGSNAIKSSDSKPAVRTYSTSQTNNNSLQTISTTSDSPGNGATTTLPIKTTGNQNNTSSKNMSLLSNNCANSNNINNNNIISTNNNTKIALETDSKPRSLSDEYKVHPITPTGNHIGDLLNDCKNEVPSQSSQNLKTQSVNSKDSKELSSFSQALTNGASKDSGISSNSSIYADCALVPSQSTDLINNIDHICAEKVIEMFKNSTSRPRKIDVNLLSDGDEPPNTFLGFPPYPHLPADKLFPSPASIFLETKKDLVSKRLQDCCQSNPISIVRNLASVLKLDMGLFSTKTLVECSSSQRIEILSHIFHSTFNGNLDELSPDDNHWAFECKTSNATISNYANYQVNSFRESLREESESKSNNSKANPTKESETDSNESASAQAKRISNNQQSSNDVNFNQNQTLNSSSKAPSAKRLKREDSQNQPRYVRSADSIDLSDDKQWRSQLNELNKLPHFIKCVSASNMLTHVGIAIPGINTVSMSMHVPGCRIFGNRAPNNFCYVNLNVGPGDYEWCAVSAEYASTLKRLCNKNGFEIEDKYWWPKINELQKYNIPIYRFSQRPGDLVWVNSGTIYWVQATGWCNNLYWNVGPLSSKQFRSASKSFELNKLLLQKSDVPMIQLTWNIVININMIFDDELHNDIVDVLKRSLKYCVLIQELVDEQSKQLPDCHQSGNHTDPSTGSRGPRFCSLCECEVFNINFIKKIDKRLNCVECARRSDPTFDQYYIEQDYDLKYLMNLYDNFIETRRKFQIHQQLKQD